MADRPSTRRTVLIAGVANLFVGVIKLVAGVLVGSSAMLAEAAHSAADTLNQAFLLTSLHRGERPADSRHPFGYGQERYFWSLLAAVGISSPARDSPSSRDCSPSGVSTAGARYSATWSWRPRPWPTEPPWSGCSCSTAARPAAATWKYSTRCAAVRT
jgi:hypothetical protein